MDGGACSFVVRCWVRRRNRYIARTLRIWLRELGDEVEPPGPNFEEPGVGNEHGCEDVSHLNLHRWLQSDGPPFRVFAGYRISPTVGGGAPRHKARMIPGGTSDSVSRSAVVLT